MLAGVERGGDGAAHVNLSGALLVALARAQGSAGAEVRLRRLHVERRAVLVRGQMARRPRRAARRDHGFPGGVRYEGSGIHCWAYYTIIVVRWLGGWVVGELRWLWALATAPQLRIQQPQSTATWECFITGGKPPDPLRRSRRYNLGPVWLCQMNGMCEAKHIQRSVSESAQIGVYTPCATP